MADRLLLVTGERAVELVELPDDDHFTIIAPESPGWRHVAGLIESRLSRLH